MANDNGGNGSVPFLAFLVGGLIVAVGVLAFFYFNGAGKSTTIVKPTVTIEKPNVSPSH